MQLLSKIEQLFCNHNYEHIASRQDRKKLYENAMYGENSASGIIMHVDMRCSKCGKEKTEKERFQ